MNTRTYAIGDIHGCLTPLKELMVKTAADLDNNIGQDSKVRLIFLGDYIDRGPDSKGVIDYLIDLKNKNIQIHETEPLYEYIFLKGNHEELFENKCDTWVINGGFQTAISYGWDGISLNIEEQIKIPKSHIEFINNLKIYYDDPENKLFFVHAGIRPELTLEEQNDYDMKWIRYEFLEYPGPYKIDRFVIHGHTPKRNEIPDYHSYRVNVDTGCVFGGYLNAIIFDNSTPVGSLQVKGPKNNDW